MPIAGSTVSWNCVQVDALGVVIPGFSDGLNGGVTIPLGALIRCTATNETATLTLVKNVVNNNGGTAVPSAWQLTATPVAPVFPGLTPTTVTGSAAGATFEVRSGAGVQPDGNGSGRLHAHRPVNASSPSRGERSR